MCCCLRYLVGLFGRLSTPSILSIPLEKSFKLVYLFCVRCPGVTAAPLTPRHAFPAQRVLVQYFVTLSAAPLDTLGLGLSLGHRTTVIKRSSSRV